ncbi:MAG: pitrilysin family protein [Candidatus Aegiribacteria sp.]
MADTAGMNPGGSIRKPRNVVVRRLKNGLTVILQRLSYSPVAAVNIAFGAGSLWETENTRGYSHLCEHMMFKGSGNFGAGKYWETVQLNGGVANAYTSRDITVYYSVLPKAGLRDILEMESDRMFNCTMKDEDVNSETAVILEEELLTQRDDPEGSLDSLLYKTAFPTHPYGRPITGTAEDIRRFTPEGLRKFYHDFYTPSNAVLSVVGDIDTDDTGKLIEDLFGAGAGSAADRPGVDPEPSQKEQRRVSTEHPSQLPRISIGFRAPPEDHPDSVALSLISVYLSSGRSSRFEELLVKPSLVLDVSSYANSHVQHGLFVIGATLPERGAPDRVEDIIFRELSRLSENGMDENTLNILKRRRNAWGMISDADQQGRSRRLTTGYAKFHDPFHHWHRMDRLQSVSREDIIRAASAYLTPANSTVVLLRPSSGPKAVRTPRAGKNREPSPDLSPPAAQEPSELEIPDRFLEVPERSVADGCREVKLGNGLRLIMRQDASFPIVSLGFSCPMGSSMEPAGLTGLAQITAETMAHGTPDEDRIEFNSRLENLGTSLDFSSTDEFSGGMITSLAQDADRVLQVISDMLRTPALRPEDLESVRSEAISSLEEWLGTPIGAAMDSFSRQSTDPPEMSSVPTRESLLSITGDDLVDFHGRCCRPEGTILVAVGNFQEDELLNAVERHFSSWKNPNTTFSPPPPARNSISSSEITVKLDGREQVALLTGSPAPSRLHEDRYAISILSRILGEGIGSRLGRKIREAGLSYHAGSMYIPLSARGRIVALVLTSPRSLPQAYARLTEEFSSLWKEKVSLNELRLEQTSYIGMQELSMMKYSSMARMLLTYASTGLPLDHDRTVMTRVCALAREDIQRAAVEWLGRGITYTTIAGGV